MSMAHKVLFGNWKMNNTREEAESLINDLISQYSDPDPSLEIGIAPAFPFLTLASERLQNNSIQVAAQNISDQSSGAFTGEVSAAMVASTGATHTLVGHSERRALYGEQNETLRTKIDQALAAGLKVIYCCGETLEQRQAGALETIIGDQIESVLVGRSTEDLANLIIAYEPVWAIGTGETASPRQAQEAHAFIRGKLTELFNAESAQAIPLLYGGSCKPSNAQELFACPDIDGGLIGGASLKAEDFIAIARSF